VSDIRSSDRQSRTDQIKEGKLATQGLLDASAVQSCIDILENLEQQGIETVRVLFADPHGILRGKTIVTSSMTSVFCSGITVPSTLILKDTSNRTVFPVWSASQGVDKQLKGASDILLVPDPGTFRVLPWTNKSAWILCDICYPGGAPLPLSPRTILQRAVDTLATNGKSLLVGLEVEFQVYRKIDPALDHASATMPARAVGTENLAQGYQLLSESRYDELEPIVELLRKQCEQLQLPLRSMEVEMGPSQLEFTFDPDEPIQHADNMVMFRTMVKEVCARENLHATFMCKPALANAAANGWHVHQSLLDINTGENLMMPDKGHDLNATASSWIAGLLAHAAESCLLTTPTVNGYKRYQPMQLAPNRIQWARDNRGAMIRTLINKDDDASRIENRVAETAANPYLLFSSQIFSGLRGLEQSLKAPAPVETPYDNSTNNENAQLPDNLLAAIGLFEQSTLYRDVLGAEFVNYLSTMRRAEWQRYHLTVSEWEQAEYFNLF
jgi:glutamine synthetase